jgi:hypothetical protein
MVVGFKIEPPQSNIPTLIFYYGGNENFLSNSDTLYLSTIGATPIFGIVGDTKIYNQTSTLKSVTVSVNSTLSGVSYITGNKPSEVTNFFSCC